MKPWTDLKALASRIMATTSREEAILAVREAPSGLGPWFEEEGAIPGPEKPPVVLEAVGLAGVPVNADEGGVLP